MGRSTALLYSHDSYGLGHLTRTLAVAGALQERRPGLSQLVCTGSRLAHAFRLPPGVDYLKLPTVTKTGPEAYEPAALPHPLERVTSLRGELLRSTAAHLRPDLVLVDNVPLGLAGELRPALLDLARTQPRPWLVLGLRDVVDEPSRVRRAWLRDGVYGLLEDVYDRILVYGERDLFDVGLEYGLSERVLAKTRYAGYLGRELPPSPSPPDDARARRVLVTVGGGGDGYPVLRTALEAAALASDTVWELVLGPFLPDSERRELVRLAGERPGVELHDFVEDVPQRMARADVVVSMGGYNSVCELVTAGRPSVVVPRVTPREEQLVRATRFAERGLLTFVHPEDLTPARLLAAVVEARAPEPASIDLGGLARAADALADLLADGALARRAS